MYDVEGTLLRKIKLLRINDLALTRDGTVMVTVNQEKLIKVQRLTDSRDVRAAPCGVLLFFMVTVNQEKLIKVQRLTDTRDVHAAPCGVLLYFMVTVNQEKIVKKQRLTDSRDVRPSVVPCAPVLAGPAHTGAHCSSCWDCGWVGCVAGQQQV